MPHRFDGKYTPFCMKSTGKLRNFIVVVVVVGVVLTTFMVPVNINVQWQSSSAMWAGPKPRGDQKQEQEVVRSDVTGDVTGGAARPNNGVHGAVNPAGVNVSTGPAFNVSEFLQMYKGHIPEDLLKVGPFRFLSNYKNPCWRSESLGRKIACFPYFYLAGFPKAGTTDVYVRLTQHPEVSRVVVKEPHWLTRKRYGNEDSGKFVNYLGIFRKAVNDIHTSQIEGYHNKIIGDCSASTFWDNDRWQIFPENAGLPEPKYTTADYIHHINPNTKFIVMIRNPVERLYSDYLYFHKKPSQRNTTLFHNIVISTIQEIQDCLKARSLRYCVYRRPERDNTPEVRVRLGMYHVYIEEYLRRFPRQQILLISTENYATNISKYLKKMFDFLELSPVDAGILASIADNTKKANSRSSSAVAVGDMLSDTRILLQEFYRPYNNRLVELLGREFNYNVHSSSV